MSSYRDLLVWQKSFSLVKSIYTLAKQLPEHEKFGLASQIERSSISIPSNIAEGQQRRSDKEFKHFLSVARGSSGELSTQLLLIQDIYDINTKELVAAVEEVQKMLYKLQSKL